MHVYFNYYVNQNSCSLKTFFRRNVFNCFILQRIKSYIFDKCISNNDFILYIIPK